MKTHGAVNSHVRHEAGFGSSVTNAYQGRKIERRVGCSIASERRP